MTTGIHKKYIFDQFMYILVKYVSKNPKKKPTQIVTRSKNINHSKPSSKSYQIASMSKYTLVIQPPSQSDPIKTTTEPAVTDVITNQSL